MNINLLSKIIKELILDNERLVIPGLGAFVAEVVPSSFTDKGYTINPPYRRLFFRSCDEKDMTLVNFYSKKNNIDTEIAEKIVSNFVIDLKKSLQEKKVVIFPELGKLRATKENNFFFVPDEDLDIYPEGFGLEPISLKTHIETKEEVSQAVCELKAIVSNPLPEQELPQDEEAVVPTSPIQNEEEPSTEKKSDSALLSYKRKLRKTILIIAISIITLAAIAISIFLLINKLNPELIDSILFNEKQLEILNN